MGFFVCFSLGFMIGVLWLAIDGAVFSGRFPTLSGILALGYFIHMCISSILRTQIHPENNVSWLGQISAIMIMTTVKGGCNNTNNLRVSQIAHYFVLQVMWSYMYIFNYMRPIKYSLVDPNFKRCY